MFGLNKERNSWLVANSIAREISRRGFPAKTKTVTIMSAAGNSRRRGIVIPGRGVAAINDDINIIVASYNNPLPWAPTFKYEGAEAAAENILRNLPLP